MKRPYAFPLFFAATSTFGLVIALLAEGWIDHLAAAALALPFLALGWRLRREPARSPRDAH